MLCFFIHCFAVLDIDRSFHNFTALWIFSVPVLKLWVLHSILQRSPRHSIQKVTPPARGNAYFW